MAASSSLNGAAGAASESKSSSENEKVMFLLSIFS
jgi:hypothetical protein